MHKLYPISIQGGTPENLVKFADGRVNGGDVAFFNSFFFHKKTGNHCQLYNNGWMAPRSAFHLFCMIALIQNGGMQDKFTHDLSPLK